MGGGREKRGRSCSNPYYMTARARELFKKRFVVLFLKESWGGRHEGGQSYYVISIKRLKIGD